MKPFQRDTYPQELSGQPLADYLEVASQLPECERAHAIACGIPATAMLRARTILPPDVYAESVDGSSTRTVRAELVACAARGELAEDLPALPKDIKDEVALVTTVQRGIDALAQAVRQKRFEIGMVSALAYGAQKLGKARGENAGEVTSLVDAVRAAVVAKSAEQVRSALEQVAEFFDLEINAPSPVATNRRAICRGIDCGLTTQLVR